MESAIGYRALIKPLIQRVPGAVAVCAFAGLLALVSLALTARWLWAGEIIVSFLWIIFPVSLLITGYLLFLRKWRMLAVSLLCTAWLAVEIVPYLPWAVYATAAASDSPGTITVASVNMRIKSQKIKEKVRSILHADADVLLLQEVDDAAAKELEKLLDQYPYMHLFPQVNPMGAAILSKYPITKVRENLLNAGSALYAEVDVNGLSVSTLNLHPYPPFYPPYFEKRNLQLARVSEAATELLRPLIVAGDLNTSMWSPHYKDFVRDQGLADPRIGRGLLLTFPVFSAFGVLTPIDHILTTSELKVEKLDILHIVDSDHLGLIARIRLPKKLVGDL